VAGYSTYYDRRYNNGGYRLIFTIFIFIIIILGLGYSLMYIVNPDYQDWLIYFIMIIGLGFAMFAVISIFMNLFGVPLHYGVFCGISIIIPTYRLIRGALPRSDIMLKPLKFPEITKHHVFAILLFVLVFGMMLQGSFSYPFLEDDDPWGHAEAAKYISITHTAKEPVLVDYHYIDPYPPVYDIFMGVMHQTNDSISWTLKFFNSLMCGLAILFFYVFIRNYVYDETAIAGTFIIAMLQSFMSHFIWSQSYLIMMFLVAFYSLKSMERDWSWFFPAVISIAAVFLTQPSGAVIFIIMFVGCFFANVLTNGFWSEIDSIMVMIIGGAVAGVYWFVMLMNYGFDGLMKGVGFYTDMVSGVGADTSSGVIYSFKDFFLPPILSRMDQPIGLGPVITIILLFSLVYILIRTKIILRQNYITLSCIWFLITLLGVQGNALPWKLMPHRFWVFLAIPVSMICGYGFIKFIYMFKKKSIRVILTGVIVMLVVLSSGFPKYMMQTAKWRHGSGILDSELDGFNKLKELPPNTRVFVYQLGRDMIAIGYDKYSPEWEPDIIDFRKNIRFADESGFKRFLKDNEYEYMLMTKNYDQYEYMKDWFDVYYEDDYVVIFEVQKNVI